MPTILTENDPMGTSSQVLQGETQRSGASRSELLWVAGILALALALREFPFLGSGWVAGGCTPQFSQRIAPILQSGNPLHFEVFYYPPVPAIIVAGFAGVWRMLGGGGVLAIYAFQDHDLAEARTFGRLGRS